MTDRYGRAYGYDLARGLAAAPARQRLTGALASNGRAVAFGGDGAALAFTIADRPGAAPTPLRLTGEQAAQARVLAMRATFAVGANTSAGIAMRQGGRGWRPVCAAPTGRPS